MAKKKELLIPFIDGNQLSFESSSHLTEGVDYDKEREWYGPYTYLVFLSQENKDSLLAWVKEGHYTPPRVEPERTVRGWGRDAKPVTYPARDVPGFWDRPADLVPNFEFEDSLELVYISSNWRSGARAIFRRKSNGKIVEMFLTEINNVLPMKNGLVTGKFTFRKQGQNFSVKLLEAK